MYIQNAILNKLNKRPQVYNELVDIVVSIIPIKNIELNHITDNMK